MRGFFESIVHFLSGLLRFINDSRLVELGEKRQQERDSSVVAEREKVANEIEENSHNVIDFDKYADRWVPDPREDD